MCILVTTFINFKGKTIQKTVDIEMFYLHVNLLMTGKRNQGCARFAEILSELTKTWSSGATECGV